MKPFTLFNFPNGLVYQVPTQEIANHRSKYFQKQFSGESPDVIAQQTVELFADSTEVIDWAKGNMNWEDLAPFARLVDAQVEPVNEESFMSATVKLADEARVAVTPTDSSILIKPLEFLFSAMAAAGQVANVVFIETGDGANDYKVALTLVQGEKHVVDGYIAVSQNFTDFMRNQANNVAAALDKAEGTKLAR